MLSHADIWRAIDRLAEEHATSLSALARISGLDPTTFNKSKRVGSDGKLRWPSTESLAKVLTSLDLNLSDFALLAEPNADRDKNTGIDIPLITMSEAGVEGYFDRHGFPLGENWDNIHFPGQIKRNVFALQISGNAFQPILRDGDRIIVSPEAEIRRGDRVLVKTRSGEMMVRTLAHISATIVELEALNPEHPPRRLDMKNINWISRIIWISQ